MTSLLDSRSRPTTQAERALLYCQTDPTEGLLFAMATEPGECVICGDAIGVLEPYWVKQMPGDSSEVQLARLDPNYEGGDIFAFACWKCTRAELEVTVKDYAAERAQDIREARLEVACAADASGDLTPDHWYTIMEANLGYCVPAEIPAFMNEAVAEYQKRYGARTEYLETVRAKLYEFVPQTKIVLEPVGELMIEQGEGGIARFSFLARVGIR